jgi:trigger factor
VAKRYSTSARVPGFRQGKVPPGVVRQRYKEQILSDVAHDLIPRVVNDALRERDLRPVVSPDIKDLVLEEGRPLTFTADFETLPPIDLGDYTGLTLSKPPAVLEVGAVDHALEHLQQRHARWTPVEDRPAAAGDTLLMDLARTRRTSVIEIPGEGVAKSAEDRTEQLQNVSVEIGARANPPGFDQNLTGTQPGDVREFTVTYPTDYEIAELAGATVDYHVTVKGIRRKDVLPLDDDFAKEVGDVDTLEALRDRVREDLQRGAEDEAAHRVRHELLKTLSSRVKAAPEVLVDQEVDRRLEEFVRRLMEQGVDPMKADMDWREFRERQREAAVETVKSTLAVDDIARRESIDATDEDIAAEIAKFAERAGHTSAAVRARLEQEGALDRIHAGIRRDKTIGWLLEKSNIVNG